MKAPYRKYKGIHPGVVLGRELKKRSIKQRPFALSLNEHPQYINAIIKGNRGLPTALALKIEQTLNIEEGTLVLLQAFYEIHMVKKQQEKISPELSTLNPALFWDTDINKIDWIRQYRAVIQRVFERGNETEKEIIIKFYGLAKVKQALKETDTRKPYTIYKTNKE